jgi:hypothetical protein
MSNISIVNLSLNNYTPLLFFPLPPIHKRKNKKIKKKKKEKPLSPHGPSFLLPSSNGFFGDNYKSS